MREPNSCGSSLTASRRADDATTRRVPRNVQQCGSAEGRWLVLAVSVRFSRGERRRRVRDSVSREVSASGECRRGDGAAPAH
jgi:hypothetical protein